MTARPNHSHEPSRLAPHRWCRQLHAANYIAIIAFAIAISPNPALFIALLALAVLVGAMLGFVILMSPKRTSEVRGVLEHAGGDAPVNHRWARMAAAADVALFGILAAVDVALAVHPGLSSVFAGPGAGSAVPREIGGAGLGLLVWLLVEAHLKASRSRA